MPTRIPAKRLSCDTNVSTSASANGTEAPSSSGPVSGCYDVQETGPKSQTSSSSTSASQSRSPSPMSLTGNAVANDATGLGLKFTSGLQLSSKVSVKMDPTQLFDMPGR
ncbi:unnamed protein product [Protopolystoma xenopodis]|uniref:Uncharacterized protein n=1 Tax=Protopolystoma xenopodis TaxID=117903 RepID=A0A3S5C7Y7_9PLAT|nr:unnamed protein product [Protopolystoma xenopodis]